MKALTPDQRQTLSSLGILLLTFGLGSMLMAHADVDSYVATSPTVLKDISKTFSLRAPMDPSEPVRLRIPDLKIDTNFVRLGLQKDGTVEVPKGYTEVGWYTGGATPGAKGAAVVLGHVDSYKGPGVFFYLGQLQPGDYVYVDRADGSTATFRVTELDRYNRDDFPADKVYGNLSYAGLRLVTCSGTYNKQSAAYNRILVVYATLVNDTKAQ